MESESRIGTDFAGYLIEAKVGQGGMGVVYRAEQARLGRKVALKVLTPELAQNAGFRERFERESRLAAAIDHPNIVPLYEAGESDGVLFITMRYVEGTDLKALIERERRLAPDRALTIAAQVASALDTAHARGLVHRDVKPGNILVAEGAGADGRDHCYLTDFGLTKDTASPVELTATGTFVGTLDYIAPEQIEGTAPDGRSDQYSLCCVLWECLVGAPPFVREAEIAVMWAHLQDAPPRISDTLPGLPAGVDAVIAKAMAKRPDDRYASCAELVAAARAELLDHIQPAGATDVGNGAPPASAPTAAHRTVPRAVPPPGRPAALPDVSAAPAPGQVAPATVTSRRAAETAPSPTQPRDEDLGVGPERRARPWALAAVGAGVLAAAAAGALAAGSSDGTKQTAAVAGAGITLTPPDSWRAGDAPNAVRGLRLDEPVALSSDGASLSAGSVADPGAALLPDALVARLPRGAAPRGEAVRLGETEALRFSGLRVRGEPDALTVYAVPTDRGAVAVTCRAPDDATLSSSGCERAAATLEVTGARPLGVAPSRNYAAGLSAVLTRLGDNRRDGRRELARARSRRAQARAASALGSSYSRSERSAGALEPPAPASRADAEVAAALGAGAQAYERLARAARAGSARRFAAATRGVSRAETRLERSLAALAALGYDVAR